MSRYYSQTTATGRKKPLPDDALEALLEQLEPFERLPRDEARGELVRLADNYGVNRREFLGRRASGPPSTKLDFQRDLSELLLILFGPALCAPNDVLDDCVHG